MPSFSRAFSDPCVHSLEDGRPKRNAGTRVHAMRAGRGALFVALVAATLVAAMPVLARPAGAAGSDSLVAGAVALALRYNVPPAAVEPASPPRTADRWVAMDKAKHLGGSALWTLATQYVLVVKANWRDGDALPVSVASAAAAGLAKEVYDRRVGSTAHFCGRDLVADALGIALATGVILL